MRHRRRHRVPLDSAIRATMATLLVVALVVALAIGSVFLLVDPNSYKPEIEAAVSRATGRTLALRGPMRFGVGLPPTLIAEDVSISNPPGASRPDLLTLERVEARIGFWPLLSGEIDLIDLTLFHPDLLLERDANRRDNWDMAPPEPSPPEAAAAPAARPGSGGQGTPPPVSRLAFGRTERSRVAFQSIHIEQGRVGWRPTPDAPIVQVQIPRIDARASGPGGTMLLSGLFRTGGRALRLTGEIGSLDRLFNRAAVVPWPLRVMLRDDTSRLSVLGSIADPLRGRGLSLVIDASVADFTGIDAFLPGNLTAPHDATLAMRWGDGAIDSGVGLAGLNLHLGGVWLPGLLPGIDIHHIDIAAPGLDRPVHADIEASNSSIGALRLVLNASTLAALLPGAHPAEPPQIDLALDAGRALISARGLVAEPAALRGVDLDMFARVPDLAAFSAIAGRPLPPMREVSFEGHLSGDLDGVGALGIRKGTLTLPQAQFVGDADIRPGRHPSIRATLAAPGFDLDSLLSDMSVFWHPKPRVSTGSDLDISPQGLPPADAQPPADPPANAPPGREAAEPGRWLIPDRPFDLSALKLFDADLDVHIDSLQAGGVASRQVSGRATLRDGKFALERMTGTMPGGPARLSASLDARAPDGPVSVSLQAPSLQLARLASAFSDTLVATGVVAVNADLRAAGRSPRALAASLDGHLGVAGTDLDLDNRLLLALLHLGKLPDVPMSGSGATRLRCLVADASLNKGLANLNALVADMTRLSVLGGGTVNLGQEQLAVELRPMLRLGGAGGVVLPVRLGGSLRDPTVTLGIGGKGGGGPPITGVGAADPCVPALAAVAGPPGAEAAPPRVPAPTQAPTPAAKAKPLSPLDVLKELIR
jgi:AsmA protein